MKNLFFKKTAVLLMLVAIVIFSCSKDQDELQQEQLLDLNSPSQLEKKSQGSDLEKNEVYDWIEFWKGEVDKSAIPQDGKGGINSLNLEPLGFSFEHKNATFALMQKGNALVKISDRNTIEMISKNEFSMLVRIGKEIGYVNTARLSMAADNFCSGTYADTGNSYSMSMSPWGPVECNAQQGCSFTSMTRWNQCGRANGFSDAP